MNIVIVGGGFGGVKTALLLSRHRGMKITLISDKDYLTYFPSLYAVATGGARRQSFIPLQSIVRDAPIKFIQDKVVGYDSQRKIIKGVAGQYSFDYAVFALGVVTNYFGIKGLETYSFGIKSSQEVAEFRRHIHDELTSKRRLDKQYVIVGAGPTGVELSASLASYIAHIADAHCIKHNRIRIKLIEAAPRVLPRMSEAASAAVTQRLRETGVEVMVGEKVEWQDDDEVFVSGRSIPTGTVVWTSGVANNPFFSAHSDSFRLADNRKVLVNENMMVNAHTYVIGDNAATVYSGLAQTALHDAHYVARDLIRIKTHQLRRPYTMYKPPVVVPVGRRWAVFERDRVLIAGGLGHVIRRCADFIGYHDILPLKTAWAVWRSEERREDTCIVCQSHG